ncbi:MAG TPA: glycosyltransferase family 2 protein [Trebonia sp.]|nr:glycosyltransferase family 2 protein [Trebonia sp.]
MEMVKYSIVIPLYNEESGIAVLVEKLLEIIAQFDGPAEIVLVDDGSKDRTYELAREVTEKDQRFKLLQFSRNFGHQMAITAGMDAASGDAVIIMDADLQDPPYVVLQMIEKWKEGYEVVYGLREHRQGERLFKTATASVFYGLLHRIADIDTPVDVGDFRLVDRKALNAFLQMRENNRYVRGMFSWVGFRQTGVPYVREERFSGTTHYTLRKMVKLASNGILGFSTAPLRLALNTGLFLAFAAVIYAIVAISLKLAGVELVPGYASLLFVVTFFSGIQLAVMGVVGLYVGRIYDEARQRPLYIIRESHGFAEEKHGPILWAPTVDQNGQTAVRS